MSWRRSQRCGCACLFAVAAVALVLLSHFIRDYILTGRQYLVQLQHRSMHRRIVALGDIHGDYEHATSILRAAGILHAENDSWAGGSTIFVSTGDTVDRGDDTIRLYRLFQDLREQSRRVGGNVINVLGNHEMMNAMMDWRYVTPGDMASFGGPVGRRQAMSLHGWLGMEWMQHYNVTMNVPLLPDPVAVYFPTQRASFVHGGITPAFAQIGVDAMNKDAHSLLTKALSAYEGDSINITKSEEALWLSDGPFWYRGYALDPHQHACATANRAIDALGVSSLIMGHTPHMSGIHARCAHGQIFIIDTGMSRAYGGRLSALEIDSYAEKRSWFTWCMTSTYSAVYVPEGRQVLHRAQRCV